MKLPFGKKKEEIDPRDTYEGDVFSDNTSSEINAAEDLQSLGNNIEEAPAIGKPQKQKKSSKKKKGKGKEKTSTPEKDLASGIPSVKDIIAPSAIEVDFNHIKIGDKYFRTLFISGYPRFVGANWLEPIINFDHSSTITMYYYPMDARNVLDDLRRKIAEMEATINISREKGKVVDPAVQAALGDAKSLQEQLVKGIERFFHFSFYITISAETIDELNSITYQMESTIGSLSMISKKATLDMEQAFQSTIPVCLDKIKVIRNMDTTSVATTFPFTSSDLTANEGILYGVNKHNGSLIIFDRFTLENANSVIFAKSGAGKSYLVKLEALRSLLFGVDIIVLDPENEFRRLSEAVGGEYIDFSLNSPAKINPFDLPVVSEGEDQLSLKILSLHALLRIMLGSLSDSESAVLDRALIDTYRLKGITQDPATQRDNEAPLMEDLYKVLLAMDEVESKALASRMERYIKGSLAGVFDQRSNINLDNSFTVFSIRNLEDILRPIAMFMVLDFIWTKIKHDLRKRLLIMDEAWTLMQYEDSAAFVYSLAKRARKYYLGLTTISQDVNDFLRSDYGKAVVTNSSIQILLKQHPASIDILSEIFFLSAGEKNFLLAAGIGEGLFFAGSNHVAMQVKASQQENALITTNPEEVLRMQREKDASSNIAKSLEEQTAEIKAQIEGQVAQANEQPNMPLDPFEQVEKGGSTIPPTQTTQSTQASQTNSNTNVPTGNYINPQVNMPNNTNNVAPNASQNPQPVQPTQPQPPQSTQTNTVNGNINNANSVNTQPQPGIQKQATMPNPYAGLSPEHNYEKGTIMINNPQNPNNQVNGNSQNAGDTSYNGPSTNPNDPSEVI